jgi:hypothetical protein
MSDVRSSEDVHAEQVQQAAQAVAQAQATANQQQADAGRWLRAGLPTDASVTRPGPQVS